MVWLLWSFLACDVAAPPAPTLAPATLVAPEPAPAPRPPALDGSDLPEPTEPRYAASHVLVAWVGARGAGPRVTRGRDEALALARELHGRAVAGEPFAELARRWSDDPSAPRGGRLGVYRTGTWAPAFERAVASVAPGEVGPVVETPWGFHVVRRDVVETLSSTQVWVSWSGARMGAAPRSRAEAEARVEQALAELAQGVPFEEVARRWSDAPAPLGPVGPGQLVPPLEEALRALEPGEVSAVVESPYGFHLLRRDG